jgi:toxin ParE1/3/4
VILYWTPRATSDREGIRDYIAQDNPEAALRVEDLLLSKAGGLIDNPRLGRPGRRCGTRELVAHPSSVLIYDVARTAVRILRVMHTARQWPPRG